MQLGLRDGSADSVDILHPRELPERTLHYYQVSAHGDSPWKTPRVGSAEVERASQIKYSPATGRAPSENARVSTPRLTDDGKVSPLGVAVTTVRKKTNKNTNLACK